MNDSALMPDQLLATKFFVPPAAQALIARPRLTALLDDSLRRKLTLVAAPAGFGKTTLVAEWLRRSELRIENAVVRRPHEDDHAQFSVAQRAPGAQFNTAWVSLDQGDNNPLRFWMYVLTALDACYPGIATPLVSYLQTQHIPIEQVLTALVNALLEIPEPLLLVLDEYDVVTQPAIHTSLTFLLEYLPPQVHLILLGRTDPPLSLSRLRARGQVLELRTDQLRCTPEEAEIFLSQVMHIALPPDALQEAIAHTEGWLVGLQLLGLWLQTKADLSDVVDQLIGSHPYILDYLMEEVLQQQPEQVQTFLLHTAFLDRICASLCDAVLGLTTDHRPPTTAREDTETRRHGDTEMAAYEPVSVSPGLPVCVSVESSVVGRRSSVVGSGSQTMLEYLERSNLFVVPLDAQRRWYRYHPLFAEALRYRLEQTQPDRAGALHQRASIWYAEHGHSNDAIQHALLARDWQRAAELIEQFRFDVALGEHGSDLVNVRQWIQRLPDEVVRSRPRLCLIYAKTLLDTAPATTINPWLAAAEATVRDALATQSSEVERVSATRPDQENLLGEVVAMRALLAGWYGDGQAALTLCQEALALLSAGNRAVRADVAYVQAMAYVSIDQIAAASQSALEARALTQAAGDTSTAIISTAIMWMNFAARQMQYQGRLHEAWRMLREAVQLGEMPGGVRFASVCWAYAIQADVLREWDRLDEAHALVSQAIEINERLESLVFQWPCYIVLARIEQARGKLDAAQAALQRAEQASMQLGAPQPYLANRPLDLVRLWLAGGELDRAAYWTERPAHDHSHACSSISEQAQLAHARVVLGQGRPAEALQRLAPLLEQVRTAERWGDAIESLVLQARAYQTWHDDRQALAALAEAVRLAEPAGYIRIFADEGGPMAALLAQLRDQDRRRGPTPYLDMLLAAFPRTEGRGLRAESLESTRSVLSPQSSALVEPLSARELEVICLLARGASNQEIAEELVLALNTVKRHVSNIIAKLGAANRTQAVAQGRALGLLADEPSVGSRLLAVAV